MPSVRPVHTENFVRIDETCVTTVCEIIIAFKMSPVFIALVALVGSTFQTRAAMQAELVALRHQFAVLQRSAPRRLRLKQSDRMLWILLSWLWPDWRHWLNILKPDTVVRWHRRGFARYWTWKSRRRPGRPRVASAIRDLTQQMCHANFLWGAPRIHGEILKLGIEVAPSTVGKYLRRHRKPPSQTWRTFLKNHMKQTASFGGTIAEVGEGPPTTSWEALRIGIQVADAAAVAVVPHEIQQWEEPLRTMSEPQIWPGLVPVNAAGSRNAIGQQIT